MRCALSARICVVALCVASAACSPPSEERAAESAQSADTATPDAVSAQPPLRPQGADGASDIATTLSISERPVSAVGGTDSMILATVGAISQRRDAEAIKTLAIRAFAAADSDTDLALTPDEFASALDFVATSALAGEVLGGQAAATTRHGIERQSAFDAAGRRSASVSQDGLVTYFDMKRVEADQDRNGALDDAEFSRFATLINGATGSN